MLKSLLKFTAATALMLWAGSLLDAESVTPTTGSLADFNVTKVAEPWPVSVPDTWVKTTPSKIEWSYTWCRSTENVNKYLTSLEPWQAVAAKVMPDGGIGYDIFYPVQVKEHRRSKK